MPKEHRHQKEDERVMSRWAYVKEIFGRPGCAWVLPIKADTYDDADQPHFVV